MPELGRFEHIAMRRFTKTTNLVVVCMGLLVFWLSQRDWLVNSSAWQKAEGALIDKRYEWRGVQPLDTNIVLVGINDSSLALDALSPEEIKASPTLQLMSQPYPWNRAVYAATLDKLMAAGAKVVVFDLMFSGARDGDDEFAQTLQKYPGRVIIAGTYDELKHNYVPPTKSLLDAATEEGVGLATIWTDPDKVFRRGTYRTSIEREYAPLNKFAADYPDNLISLSARAVQKFVGNVETPPYGHDNFVNFSGLREPYKPLPIEMLFVDKLWRDAIKGPTAFQGKIVVVGPIANMFQDVHDTPLGQMPGPDIQATMMSTLLHHSSLEELSPRSNSLLTLFMVTLALVFCLFVDNALLKAGILIATTVIFLAVCQVIFTQDHLVVAMAAPLFGFVTSGFLGLVFQYILEQLERRRYLVVLERYVSKNVANAILSDKRSFVDSLSGRKQSLSVLFSDIRGFTGMTEEREAEQLVKQLNEYFLEMVGVVLEEGGTLQKFIGDAIMAAWGDVHSLSPQEDARRAVRTALRMRAGLVKLNQQWETQPNRIALSVGIGINNGEMIVGNIGHPQRMEFTVLGDGVNLAARLESATKQFRTDLLVGESIEALTREHFIFRRVGLLTVKGKSKPVEAFDVLGERPETEPAWLSRYHEAVVLFRKRQFEDACALFKLVAQEIGKDDYLCDLYLSWCANYLLTPPPADWNGTFVLSEK